MVGFLGILTYDPLLSIGGEYQSTYLETPFVLGLKAGSG